MYTISSFGEEPDLKSIFSPNSHYQMVLLKTKLKAQMVQI